MYLISIPPSIETEMKVDSSGFHVKAVQEALQHGS